MPFLLFSIFVQEALSAHAATVLTPLAICLGLETAYPNPPFSEYLIAPVDPKLDNTSFLSDLEMSWNLINQVI